MSAEIPETYHALSRAERDHLLAVARLSGSRPLGVDVQAEVQQLRGGERPCNGTTYRVLDDLEAWGLVDSDTDAKRAPYAVTMPGVELIAEITSQR